MLGRNRYLSDQLENLLAMLIKKLTILNKNLFPSVKKSAGFTIVEIIVSTGIFVIAVGSLLSLFNYTLKINRRTEALRQASQGMRNFIEFFTKEIRNGQIDYGIVNGQTLATTWPIGPCNRAADLSRPTYNVNSDNKDNWLALFTDDGIEECVFYADENNAAVGAGVYAEPAAKIQAGKNYGIAIQKTGVASVQILNPPNFRVDALTFYVHPYNDPYTLPYPKIQPFVTISVKFTVQLPTGEQQPIYYQTTVSSNKYDISH